MYAPVLADQRRIWFETGGNTKEPAYSQIQSEQPMLRNNLIVCNFRLFTILCTMSDAFLRKTVECELWYTCLSANQLSLWVVVICVTKFFNVIFDLMMQEWTFFDMVRLVAAVTGPVCKSHKTKICRVTVNHELMWQALTLRLNPSTQQFCYRFNRSSTTKGCVSCMVCVCFLYVVPLMSL